MMLNRLSTQPHLDQHTPGDEQAIIKPQYVDHIPKAVRGNVRTVLESKDQRQVKDELLKDLDLEQVCCWHACVCMCARMCAC